MVSEPRTKASSDEATDTGELDQIADDLYAQKPDLFAAARDEHVRKARADGRAALARDLNKLRKPTQSAWLINLVWRDQRDVMEQLFEVAEALSQAQAQSSGPELLRLTAQRRELESALMRRARTLAEKAGVSVSALMEREAQETLAAAVALPEVAQEVRSGRLVKPVAYAGFGTGFGALIPPAHSAERHAAADKADGARQGEADDAKSKGATADLAPKPDELAPKRAAASARDKQAGAEAERAEPGRQAKVADFEARTAQRTHERRQTAEQRVDEARAAFEVAAGALADQGRAIDAAARHKQELQEQQQDVRQRLADLQKEVDEQRQRQRDLQAEVVAAEQATLAAMRRRDHADKAHEAAQRTLEQAQQLLKETP